MSQEDTFEPVGDVVEGEIVGEEAHELALLKPKPLPATLIARRGRVKAEDVTVAHVERFLDHLAITGLINESSKTCGLSPATIARLRKEHPEFEEMLQESMDTYKDSLVKAAHSRAVDGWDEPVFSQKTGGQIGEIRRFDSRLLELMLKRHIPEFREKFEGEVKVTGGVLVAPIPASTMDAWMKKHENATYEAAAKPEEDGGPAQLESQQ